MGAVYLQPPGVLIEAQLICWLAMEGDQEFLPIAPAEKLPQSGRSTMIQPIYSLHHKLDPHLASAALRLTLR
jgi:hypothetical protein